MAGKSESLRQLEILIGARFLRQSDLDTMDIQRPDVSDLDRAEAVSKLLDELMESKETSTIINDHNAGKESLLKVLHNLEAQGAAYWIKGSYVPVAALVDTYTLDYCLTINKLKAFNILVINQVLGYFDGITKQLVLPDDISKITRHKP